MAADWTSIRLRRETLRRLNAEAQFLLRAYTQGRLDLPNAGEGLSLDAVVNRLLDSVQAHRARAVAQRQRAKRER